MIEEGIMNLVLQGGANALFAGFLFYQNRELQRRSDERELKLEAREEKLTKKYDKRIDQQEQNVIEDISRLEARTTKIEARLEAILILLNDIKERVFNGNNK
tara:strand:+ start:880 stop:1185 length:306 start_codon:yes stop_codon:yes gene_type:complete